MSLHCSALQWLPTTVSKRTEVRTMASTSPIIWPTTTSLPHLPLFPLLSLCSSHIKTLCWSCTCQASKWLRLYTCFSLCLEYTSHRYLHGSFLCFFHMSSLTSPYQRSLPWQPYIKWHLTPLKLFSNLLAMLHRSSLLSNAWHNIYVFNICILPENIRVLKERLFSVLFAIRS